ncbi:hypothetical protein DOTSEDRAFT_139803, partial [Dothistroma septosporum NZE10]
VKPVLARLKAHPELFSDARAREKFFHPTSFAAIRCMLEYIRLSRNGDKCRESLEKPSLEADKSCPIDPVLGVPYRRWQSWCRQLALRRNSPIIQAMLARHKGLRPSTSQLSPYHSLLLAERRRLKPEAIIADIMEVSNGLSDLPGVSAVVSQVMARPKKTESSSKNFALGEQSHGLAGDRLSVQLDIDYTT